MSAWWQNWAELIARQLAHRWQASQGRKGRSAREEADREGTPSKDEALHSAKVLEEGEQANPRVQEDKE
jgi:hypothetical protein